MVAFLQSHTYIVISAAIFLVLLCVIALCVFMKRRKSRKEFEAMSQYKRRDDALAEALRNPQARDRGIGPKGPMEITWDDKAVSEKGRKGRSLMAEIVELSEYSRRRYVYRLDQPVRIGSGKGNQLELLRDGVAESHCEIFLNGDKPCARSLSSTKTLLKRGTASAIISPEGVYLNSGDRIQMGSAEIQFRMFRG